MVLLAGAAEKLAGQPEQPARPGPGAAAEGQDEQEEEEEEDCEEYEDFSELPDTCSIASDDSFYPPGGPEDGEGDGWSLGRAERDSPEALSFFRACCTNNAVVLRALLRQGPEEDEVRETDRNRRNGLIVACYQGYVGIVIALAQCPHLDVNWQDSEGNTALITAAQA
ncbi:ankyrin repeat domain-containing protein 33B, partial [Apteryx rowi]|uniref:ankyrin repeat domain-containing protein 33B n=1 Tax=Apteryx rowi TaxID=308060 RepID=UPI000E1CAD7E